VFSIEAKAALERPAKVGEPLAAIESLLRQCLVDLGDRIQLAAKSKRSSGMTCENERLVESAAPHAPRGKRWHHQDIGPWMTRCRIRERARKPSSQREIARVLESLHQPVHRKRVFEDRERVVERVVVALQARTAVRRRRCERNRAA
jgi:hypothetical protein